MQVSFLSPPYTEDERKAVADVMMGKDLADGRKKLEFEAAFADYIGVDYAVAVNSGTSALELSLQAAIALGELHHGDQVIVPSFTFTAVANAVKLAGLVPIFTDINPETLCMEMPKGDLDPKIKGIIAVHTFGQQCVYETTSFAKQNDLFMVEDCCEACGAEWFNNKVGKYGGAAAFSFTPTKNMTTGEGGMVVTNDLDIAETVKRMSENGMFKPHDFKDKYLDDPSPYIRDCVIPGHNYRMSEIQAAIGIVQLDKLEYMNAIRRTFAASLSKHIEQRDIDVTTPKLWPDSTHSFQLYTVVLGNSLKGKRDDIVKSLNDSGIEAKVYFDLPIHQQKAYIGYPHLGELTHTEDIAKRVLSLPMNPQLTQNDLWYMANKLAEAVR